MYQYLFNVPQSDDDNANEKIYFDMPKKKIHQMKYRT